MARSISQTLTRFSPLSISLSTATTASSLVSLRRRSNFSKLFSGELPAEEVERVAMKNLEDAIHKIIVRRSQPDWIPLVPGASYWVPPKSMALGFAQVIGKLVTNSTTTKTSWSSSASALRKGKSFSLSSSNRGWPSSAHFFKGATLSPLEGETTSKRTSQPEDEEG